MEYFSINRFLGSLGWTRISKGNIVSIWSGKNRILSVSNGMSGNMNGKFYGPALNEVGGTYAVTGSGVGSMVGGFGGKR